MTKTPSKPPLKALQSLFKGSLKALERLFKGPFTARLTGESVVAQDPVNCARARLEEAPSLEWLNLTFEGLAEPLSYVPNTEGSLEKDISDLFNVLVSIFNELFEEHLPGAIARRSARRLVRWRGIGSICSCFWERFVDSRGVRSGL